MKKILAVVLGFAVAGSITLTHADSLELIDGSVLEGALVVEGATVVPRGAFLYGVVVASSQSGRAVGSSSIALEFTDIMINDQLIPIATSALAAQTGNEGGRTVGRTARSAALGGLIGGSSGAKTGAKIGLGASILTSGSSVNVPAGTLLETTLRVPLSL